MEVWLVVYVAQLVALVVAHELMRDGVMECSYLKGRSEGRRCSPTTAGLLQKILEHSQRQTLRPAQVCEGTFCIEISTFRALGHGSPVSAVLALSVWFRVFGHYSIEIPM